MKVVISFSFEAYQKSTSVVKIGSKGENYERRQAGLLHPKSPSIEN